MGLDRRIEDSVSEIQLQLDIMVDGQKSQSSVTLKHSEHSCLERYGHFCRTLETTILGGGKIGPIKIDMNKDGAWVLSVNPPEREQVSHALHELRPLVLKKEPTEFGKVRNIVANRVRHDDLQAYLKFLKRYYQFRPLDTDPVPPQAGMRFRDAFDTATEQGLQNYLNAFEYHRDPDKEAEILRSVGEPNRAVLQQCILFSLMQRVGVILDLSSLCKAITARGRAFRSGFGWKPQLFVRQTPC